MNTDLEGLEPVLVMLRERARFQLYVHPEHATEAGMAILKTHTVGLVQLVVSARMRPGDAHLTSANEDWQFQSVHQEIPPAAVTPVGA